MVRFVPIEHDPFRPQAGAPMAPPSLPQPFGPNMRFQAVDHDPFAEDESVAQPQAPQSFADFRAQANRELAQTAAGGPAPADAPRPEPRFGDSLRPAFGGHNPIEQIYDKIITPFIPDPDQPISERPLGDRAADTAAFAASMPVRAFTRGEYGAGDIVSAAGFPDTGAAIEGAEQSFAQHNRPQLEALQRVGEATLGAQGASLAPMLPRNPPRPVVEGAPQNYRPGPGNQMAGPGMDDVATARARAYVSDLDELGIPRFGPAVAQAAREGEGMGTVAKALEGMPLVSRPLVEANRNFVQGAVRSIDDIGGRYSREGANPERVGATARGYLERFRDERAIDRDTIRAMPDDELRVLASQAPREIGSFKTSADARYEQAWRNIPEEYRQGGSQADSPRLMGQMQATRDALRSIHDDNVRMMNRSRLTEHRRRGEDTPENVLPTPQGGLYRDAIPFRGGVMGQTIEAILDGRWSGNLQTMRDIRSQLRRQASRVADTEGNVLVKSQLQRLQSAVKRDMDAMMDRIATEFETGTRVTGKGKTKKTERFAPPNPEMAARFRQAKRDMDASDRHYRAYQEAMDDLQTLFNANSDMQVVDRIIAAAQAGGRLNTNTLLRVRQVTPDRVLDDIAAGVLARMGQPTGRAGGATQDAGFSISKAVAQWNAMPARARQLIFGHRPEHYRSLNKWFNVAQGMADYERLANFSRSGTHGLAGAAMMAGPAYLLANWQGLLMTGAGMYGAAHWLTSPSYVNWLTRSAQIRKSIDDGSMTAQAAQTAVARQGRELAKLIRKDKSLDPNAAANILRGLGAASGSNGSAEDTPTGLPN